MVASRSTARLRVAAVTLTCLVALAGCSDDPPERAGTIEGSADDAASSTPDIESAPTSASDSSAQSQPSGDDAGRQLTQAETKQALPSVADMPTGWSVDPDNTLGDDGDDDSVIRPARCDDLFNGLDDLSEDPAATSDVTFTAGALGPFLGVEVSSMPNEVPDDALGAVLDVLDSCSTFKLDDGNEVSTLTASPLSFPNLGQESVAVRFDVKSPSADFSFDLIGIRIGHNMVTVTQASFAASAGNIEPVQEAAEITVENLNN